MATNLIKNGTFNDSTIDHWLLSPESQIIPAFVERTAKPVDWALALPGQDKLRYIQQDVNYGGEDGLSDMLTVPIEARAEKGRSIILGVLIGVDQSGSPIAQFDLKVVGTEWTKIKCLFTRYGTVYNPVIRISAIPIENENGPKDQRSEILTYVDNIELYIYPNGSEEAHSS